MQFGLIRREKARFQADEQQIALEESKSQRDQLTEDIKQQLNILQERITSLTETNCQLSQQNETEKNQFQEDLHREKQLWQDQTARLSTEMQERDTVVNRLTQEIKQLQCDLADQRTKLQGQLLSTVQETEAVELLQQDLYVD